MSYVEIHRYCKAYQIENEQCPPKLKLQNLLALLELLSYIKIEEKYEDEEILDANVHDPIFQKFAKFFW